MFYFAQLLKSNKNYIQLVNRIVFGKAFVKSIIKDIK